MWENHPCIVRLKHDRKFVSLLLSNSRATKLPLQQGAWCHSRPCDVWGSATHWPPSCWLDQVRKNWFSFLQDAAQSLTHSCCYIHRRWHSSPQGWLDKHHFGWTTLWSNEHPQHNWQRAWTSAHNRGSFSEIFYHLPVSKLSFGQVIALEDESYLYYDGPLPQCKKK